jgi:predicted HAD superfamily Cof-like phosphohydrolase
MTKLRDQVMEFSKAFAVHIRETPGIPDDDTVKLRLKLIGEEFCELLEACGYRGASIAIWSRLTDALSAAPKMDLVAAVDALGDMQYVISGSYLACGVDDEPITDEIHASNMTKLGADGKPVYLPGGKVGKGPSFRRPDLKAVLVEEQGWNPGGEP